MRQILLNSGGAVVARVPRPIVEPGSVLVRVHYSLDSMTSTMLSVSILAAVVFPKKKIMLYSCVAPTSRGE